MMIKIYHKSTLNITQIVNGERERERDREREREREREKTCDGKLKKHTTKSY